MLRRDALEEQRVVPGAFRAVMAGTCLGHKRCILFREGRGGKLQENVMLDPFPQMAHGQQDVLRLAAARVALLPASGQRFLLLLGLQFRQEQCMAQANFVFGKCFDRCGGEFGQAEPRGLCCVVAYAVSSVEDAVTAPLADPKTT